MRFASRLLALFGCSLAGCLLAAGGTVLVGDALGAPQ